MDRFVPLAPRKRSLELLEVITVGFPFCGFKILAATLLLSAADGGMRAIGTLLLALGLIDLAINSLNLLTLLVRGWRITEACLITVLIHRLPRTRFRWSPENRHDIGNAIDTLISFCLVAVLVGGGLLPRLAPEALTAWNLCVVFNVLGAGVGRLAQALRPGYQRQGLLK